MARPHPSNLMPDLSRADGEPAMLAMAVPILPGKLDRWRALMHDLAGPRHREWQAQRRRLGLRERLFLQHTPNGALAIVVLEARDLQSAMHAIGSDTDEFSVWIRQLVLETEGLDLAAPPPGPLPELAADSGPLAPPAA